MGDNKLIKTYKPGDEWMSAPATWNAANNDIIINAFGKEALARIQTSTIVKGEVNALIHEVAPTLREKIRLEKELPDTLREAIADRYTRYFGELPAKETGHAANLPQPGGSHTEDQQARKEQQNDQGPAL